jgi:hypothetical protein
MIFGSNTKSWNMHGLRTVLINCWIGHRKVKNLTEKIKVGFAHEEVLERKQ